MGSGGSFHDAILHLANWFGNVMLPIGAALILAIGLYRLAKGYDFERYAWGAAAAMMCSGLMRLIEVIASQNTGADQLMTILLTTANIVANAILPLYAVFEFIRALAGVGGVFERLAIGDDWLRHLLTGCAMLMVSGIVRFIEYMIRNAHVY